MALKKVFGQTVFPIYTIFLLFLCFVGFQADDKFILIASGVAGLMALLATIIEFISKGSELTSQKGYPLIIITCLLYSIAMFARMMYTKAFLSTGIVIVISALIAFASVFILMPKD